MLLKLRAAYVDRNCCGRQRSMCKEFYTIEQIILEGALLSG